jgi:leucyl/phenylalanyl-tRNA--protein transferase
MDTQRRHRALDPEFVLEAYMAGFFPMADPESDEISWYSPDPRAILPINNFHVTRSLRSVIQKGTFDIRTDTSFLEVISGCSDRAETWISDEVRNVFLELYTMGHAHSIEAWQGDHLVGGLYGLAIRGAFFGESMFSRIPNASKAALVYLIEHLRNRRFLLLDVQYMTNHLARFGAAEVPRVSYMNLLNKALRSRAIF